MSMELKIACERKTAIADLVLRGLMCEEEVAEAIGAAFDRGVAAARHAEDEEWAKVELAIEEDVRGYNT